MNRLFRALLPLAGAMALIAVSPARAGDPAAQPAPAADPQPAEAPAPAGEPEPADAPAPTVEDLENRLRILERNREIEAEQAAEKAKTAPSVTAGREGFAIKSADGSWALRIRGLLDFDGRFVRNEEDRPFADTFLLRRVRPIFEGTLGRLFDFRFVPDFAEGKTVLQDAYTDIRLAPTTRLRVGKFKSPFGLERLQSASDIAFVERALPTNLVPNRDLGIMGQGDLAKGAFAWQLGIFNGVPDGSSADADSSDGKDSIGRVVVKPVRSGPFKGLAIGVAGSAGAQEGTTKATGLASYKTFAQVNFFDWRTGTSAATTVLADGRRTRWSPQLWFEAGRFGLQAEYVASHQEVALGATTDTVASAAWQATASWVVTGEDASWRGVNPRRPVGQGGCGAWEIVARAGALTIDDAAFPVFADPAASARRAQEVGLGVNGWLSRNVKVMADVVRTAFRGGAAAGGDRDDEIAALTRFQVSF